MISLSRILENAAATESLYAVPPWKKKAVITKGPKDTKVTEPEGEKEIVLADVAFTDLVDFAFWPTQPNLIARHLRRNQDTG